MKTEIIIELDTEFKKLPLTEDGEDITVEAEDEFHNSIFHIIEDFIHDEEFEGKWQVYMDRAGDKYEYLPIQKNVDFSELGRVSIKMFSK